jgi:hypothetical protein
MKLAWVISRMERIQLHLIVLKSIIVHSVTLVSVVKNIKEICVLPALMVMRSQIKFIVLRVLTTLDIMFFSLSF